MFGLVQCSPRTPSTASLQSQHASGGSDVKTQSPLYGSPVHNPEEDIEPIPNEQGPEEAPEASQATKQDAASGAGEQGGLQVYKARVETKFNTGEDIRYDSPEMRVVFDAFKPFQSMFSPHTVILHGRPGVGKSALAKSVMLGWAQGKLYQEMSYVFFFCVREIKWTEKRSLAQLIAREWPYSPAPLTEIMSQPERLLFVIDGFDSLDSALLQDDMELSGDWKDEQPVPVLMYSLLVKVLLPKSFLMITTRDTSLEKLKSIVVSPRYIMIEGLSATKRTRLVLKNIPDDHQRMQVLHSVIDNQQLFDQCQVPSVCSLVCEALKLQGRLGESGTPACQTFTSLYATLVFHQLTPKDPSRSCLSLGERAVLTGLCRMAAEGVWSKRSVFDDDDLQSHGLTVSEVSLVFHMNLLVQVEHGGEECYSFFHDSLQDFCAALYYVLEDLGRWDQRSVFKNPRSITELKRTDLGAHLLGMKRFLFGLMNKDVAGTLEALLGCPVYPAVRQKLQHWVSLLGQRISTTSPTDVLDAFHFVFESQDEEFVCLALNSFQDLRLLVNQKMDLMVSSYCLRHCQNLKTIRVDVRDIFSTDKITKQCPVVPQQMQHKPPVMEFWENFCSVLSTHPNLTQLDLGTSVLSEWAMKILCLKLRNSTCNIQALTFKSAEVSSGLRYLWMILVTNRNLKYLNLGNVLMKDDDVKVACEALKHPNCSLETLRLDSCELTQACYTMIATLLHSATSLKSLSLARNRVGEKSMRILCGSLSSSECALQRLILDSCELTPLGCHILTSALFNNRNLTHLCLSNNSLGTEEVRRLCQFTKRPECALQRLILNHCNLRGEAYGFLALMLVNSRNLTHLSLTMNPMQDSGMKLLCEAMKEPTCHLRELELVDCQLTEGCCKDLACAITRNKHLKSLDLGNNALNDRGVTALCKGLKQSNSSLTRLGLEACGLTAGCCEALSSALSSNKHLTSINLMKNDFSTLGMSKLCSAFLHDNSNLWRIGLWKQQYRAQVRRQLEEVQFIKPLMVIDGDWYSDDDDDRNWWKN